MKPDLDTRDPWTDGKPSPGWEILAALIVAVLVLWGTHEFVAMILHWRAE